MSFSQPPSANGSSTGTSISESPSESGASPLAKRSRRQPTSPSQRVGGASSSLSASPRRLKVDIDRDDLPAHPRGEDRDVREQQRPACSTLVGVEGDGAHRRGRVVGGAGGRARRRPAAGAAGAA